VNVAKRYKKLHKDVQSVVGEEFRAYLVVGPSSEFPKKRNMAYCYVEHDGSIFIVISPKLAEGSSSRVEAILRHELAHAIEFHTGETELREMARVDGNKLHRGEELRADQIAEIIWGDPIYYDKIDVQTLERGQRPRPKHLGE